MTAQEFIDQLFAKIQHGDDKHQQWLKDELQAWVPVLEENFAPISSEPDKSVVVKHCAKCEFSARALGKIGYVCIH